MQTRKLGTHGPTVGAIGLGCMGMSHYYDEADEAESMQRSIARSSSVCR
jgi:aryl-alcohol dehydrogenase-like predicted oxidoreductase